MYVLQLRNVIDVSFTFLGYLYSSGFEGGGGFRRVLTLFWVVLRLFWGRLGRCWCLDGRVPYLL